MASFEDVEKKLREDKLNVYLIGLVGASTPMLVQSCNAMLTESRKGKLGTVTFWSISKESLTAST